VRLGWNVTIIASDLHLHRRTYTRRSDPSNREVIHETVDGVEFRWVWAAPYERNDWRRVLNWLTFSRAVQAASGTIARPDVVIGSSPQLFAARAAQCVAKKFGVRFVFEVRDLWPETLTAAGSRRGLAFVALAYVANQLYKSSAKILVLAEGTQDYLIGRGVPRSKLVHIPNGVDIHAIRPPRAVPEKPAGVVTFVYAGAHGPMNGLEQVLDAAELLRESKNIQFKLFGDGPSKAALKSAAASRGLHNVEFRDSVSKEAIAEILQSADAGLMILRDATLFSFGVSPNKLFDYLAAGLPVVCNVPGEVARMLEKSSAGIQVASGSAEALARGVREFVQLTPEERKRKGLAGRAWVEREHGREVLGVKLDRFLRAYVSGEQ